MGKKTFLVQVDENGVPSYDFCHTLLKSREYLQWMKNDDFDFRTVNADNYEVGDPDSYIPVGSVQFVADFVKKYYGKEAAKQLKPIYPLCWNGQYCGNLDATGNVNPYQRAQLMSNTGIKWHLKNKYQLKHPDNGDYTVFEILAEPKKFDNTDWYWALTIEPVTEWRFFVHNHKIVGMKHYGGDEWVLPNKNVVERFVRDYEKIGYDPAAAYTLDVCVAPYNGATEIIEFHEFYACGLYGFSDFSHIPFMFSQQWFKILSRIKKK